MGEKRRALVIVGDRHIIHVISFLNRDKQKDKENIEDVKLPLFHE